MPLLKLFLQHLLVGLEYLHSEGRIVHTGDLEEIYNCSLFLNFFYLKILKKTIYC